MPQRSSSLPPRGLSVGGACEHRVGPVVVVGTELGYHARCLRCDAVGPGQPTSERAACAFSQREGDHIQQ
jgi:hypothetical protein